MVLELPVALALAVLGLSAAVLLLVEDHVRRRPALWVGVFGGVLLYLILHDVTESFILEPFVRLILGTPTTPGEIGSFSLIALGLLLGWVLVRTLLSRDDSSPAPGSALIPLLASLLALHSAADGIVVGRTLQVLRPDEVIAPAAVLLQGVHRFLEGGILVVAMTLAGARKLPTLILTLYVGLPFLLTTPWPLYATFETISVVSFVLGFVLISGFITFAVLAAWPVLRGRVRLHRGVSWILLGFFLTLIAHALAH